MQVLTSLAPVSRVDTAALESRHATVRRLLTVGSVQRHVLFIVELAAKWQFTQLRTRQTGFAAGASSRRSGAHRGRKGTSGQAMQGRTAQRGDK